MCSSASPTRWYVQGVLSYTCTRTTVKSMRDHPSERRAASAPTKNCTLFPKGNRSPASPAFRKTTHTPFFLYREMASKPWDPRPAKAGDIKYIMQVPQPHLNRSLCPFVFCHSQASVSYRLGCVQPYLQLSASRLRTAMMQVSKDTPDELAARTKPLEPVAKRVPRNLKQLREQVSV